METEQLKPSQITADLENRLTQLKKVLAVTEKRLANTPKGHLRVSQKGHNPEFYHITEPGDTHGTYIPHAKLALARRLAQKDYDSRLIKQLKQEIRALQKYLAQTKGGDSCSIGGASTGHDGTPGSALTAIYTKLCPARQSLVTPVTLTDAQYAEQWQAVTWTGLPFSEDSKDYITARRERVRSKSEVIIANTLARHGIPYRYEYPLELKNGHTVHPDFLCLNVRTRAEFYWEHFGLMDEPDYLERTLAKIKDYAESDILPGKNFLFTMESVVCHLSTIQVENLINEFLI